MKYILGPGAKRLTEPQMMSQVIDIAHTMGFSMTYHTEFSLRAKGTSIGYPDLTLVRGGDKVVYFEVKGSVKSRVGNGQADWCRALRSAGNHAYIVYPKDLELIVDILDGTIDAPERGTGFVDVRLAPLLENEPEPIGLGGPLESDESGRVRWRSFHTA